MMWELRLKHGLRRCNFLSLVIKCEPGACGFPLISHAAK